MATLAELITNVRERLDEATETHWTDTEIRRWINEGAKDLTRRTESLQDTSDIPAVVGTQQYALPTDVIRLYRVEYSATGEELIYTLEYRDFNDADAVWWTHQATSQSTPFLFTMWGFPPSLNMVVYPKPSAAGSFKVFYYRLPVVLALDGADDALTVEVPQGWEDTIVDYAEYVALRKDRDQRWQEAKSLYEEHVGTLFDLSRRWTDQTGQFTPHAPMVPTWLIYDT